MAEEAPASLDRWLDQVFDHDDKDWYHRHPVAAGMLPVELGLQYLTTAYNQPALLFDRYTHDQIANGLWYLTMCGLSGWGATLRWPKLSIQDRAAFIDSVYVLFRDGFAAHCSPDLTHRRHTSELNGICYMYWDLIGLPSDRELYMRAVSVLGDILKLPNLACQESAIHGLGHLDNWTRRPILRAYRNQPDINSWLRTYADAALRGRIQ